MAALNLFPAHVAFVDREGKLTAEAYRTLQAIYQRVGGSFGYQGIDVFCSQADENSSPLIEPVYQPIEVSGELPSLTQPIQEAQNQAEMVLQPSVTGSAIQAITPGASPYTYRAQTEGTLSVVGGTMSVLSLTRAGVTMTLATSTPMIPLSPGDAVAITYSVAPDLKLIPR